MIKKCLGSWSNAELNRADKAKRLSAIQAPEWLDRCGAITVAWGNGCHHPSHRSGCPHLPHCHLSACSGTKTYAKQLESKHTLQLSEPQRMNRALLLASIVQAQCLKHSPFGKFNTYVDKLKLAKKVTLRRGRWRAHKAEQFI
ncbi:hypothetical protein NQZ68_027549 [Dissostichus eleginoides]|nr:hypothetical protein NQZ68_027549 [Dissostichus eleginoides]